MPGLRKRIADDDVQAAAVQRKSLAEVAPMTTTNLLRYSGTASPEDRR